MSKASSFLIGLGCLAAGIVACGNSSNNDAGPTMADTGTTADGGTTADRGPTADAGTPRVVSDATAAPTWSMVYTGVISRRCTPCHTTPGGIGITQGGLDMTSQSTAHRNLVNAPAAGFACAGKGTRVVPGSPDTSIMYLKVSLDDPAPCGSKMPLGGPSLSQQDADMIESWIKAGAKND